MATFPALPQETQTKVTPALGVKISAMGNGAVRGRASQSGLVYALTAVYDQLTLTQRDTVNAFYEANKTIVFSWKALESNTTYTRCRFAEQSAIAWAPRPGRKFQLTVRMLTSSG
jgi:hypothetical protein